MMNNIIDDNKNNLINAYKELLIKYEDSRKNYESVIQKLEQDNKLNTSNDIWYFCTKVVAFNNSWTVAQFALITLDGKTIYKGQHLAKGQSDYIDLYDLGIPYETEFKLKAIVDAGDDSIAAEYILYRKDYPTLYFSLTGNAFKTKLSYVGESD